MSAHASRGSRSTGSTTHGLSGRVRAVATLFTGIAPHTYARGLRSSPLSAHTHTHTYKYIDIEPRARFARLQVLFTVVPRCEVIGSALLLRDIR